MSVLPISTYSSSLLEIVANGNNYSRSSRVTALNILAEVQPGLSPEDTPKLTCVINDLTNFIKEESSDYQHEALSTLDHILNTKFPLPQDFDYYRTLNELIATLDKTTVAKTQRKIALVMSSLLTHILLNLKVQKEFKMTTIGLISDEKRKTMKEVLEKLAKLKEKEQREASNSDEGYYMNYLLNYNIEALKLLSTDKSSKEKGFEAAVLVLGGLTSIMVDKKVVTGLVMFKDAFALIDIQKSWFPIALSIKGLEITSAKLNKEGVMQLLAEVKYAMEKKNNEGIYQGLLSLSRVALHGETEEVRQIAANRLDPVKESKKSELLQGYARHLAKVANHGKTDLEKAKARDKLLSLKLEGQFVARKKDGVKFGSEKQKATAKKMEGFRTFDSEALKVLKPVTVLQTTPKTIPKNEEVKNTSPQASPPPATTPLNSTQQESLRTMTAKTPCGIELKIEGLTEADFAIYNAKPGTNLDKMREYAKDKLGNEKIIDDLINNFKEAQKTANATNNVLDKLTYKNGQVNTQLIKQSTHQKLTKSNFWEDE